MQTKTVNEENELLERPELQIQFVLKYKPPGRKPKKKRICILLNFNTMRENSKNST